MTTYLSFQLIRKYGNIETRRDPSFYAVSRRDTACMQLVTDLHVVV